MMNRISLECFQILSLSQLKGVGPVALKRACSLMDAGPVPIEVIAREIPSVSKALEGADTWERAKDQALEQVGKAEEIEARIICPVDDDYPALLAATRDDPSLIFVRGNLKAKAPRSVAIIGTREPTEHGGVIAKRMATFFSEQGWSVVSGLAIGCDAIAHQATLDAGGHTIAVLAHGLQTVAPARHRKLADDILLAGGALVSEFPIGQEALPQQFVKRDRTQAGLAEGVVMIQSDLKGGSLHASRASIDYGRWLAVPYPTVRDCENNEPKIQANLTLIDGPNPSKSELLRCKESDLDKIVPIRGRNDYDFLINKKSNVSQNIPQQRSLF